MTALLVGAGLALLVLLSVDAFVTVFHARGFAGPLSRVLNRAIWRAFTLTARPMPAPRRDAWLSWAGPLMMLTALVVWMSLLTISFALLYLPWLPELLTEPGGRRIDWVEAIYYSGSTASTLGLGDVIPDTPALRILAPIQAFAGFALLSLSVTYMLSTFQEVIRLRALAADIGRLRALLAYGERDGGGAADALRQARLDGIVRRADRIERDLQHSLHASHQYPILHYFRPAEPEVSLLLQLRALVVLRHDPAAGAQWEDPTLDSLWKAVVEYLHSVEGNLLGTRHAEPDATRASLRLLAHHGYDA